MTMKKGKTKQLGQLLIEKGLITQEQLQQALDMQVQEGGLLGQILIKLEFVTDEQIKQSISDQESSFKQIEHVLLEHGLMNQDQLAQAIALREKEGGLLAQVIVKLGILGEEDIVSTMVTQYGMPYLQLENYDIDTEIVKLVPREVAEKHCLIPIDKIGDILTLAMADPLNVPGMNEVKSATGLKIEAFISTFTDISNAITQYYPK